MVIKNKNGKKYIMNNYVDTYRYCQSSVLHISLLPHMAILFYLLEKPFHPFLQPKINVKIDVDDFKKL